MMPSYVQLPIMAVDKSKTLTNTKHSAKQKTSSPLPRPPTTPMLPVMRLFHPPSGEIYTSPENSLKPICWPFRRKNNSRLLSTPSPKSTSPPAPHHTRRACRLVGEDRSLGIISRVSCITNVAHQATQLLSVGDNQPTVCFLVRTDPSQNL